MRRAGLTCTFVPLLFLTLVPVEGIAPRLNSEIEATNGHWNPKAKGG